MASSVAITAPSNPRAKPAAEPLDVKALRRDFPILNQRIHGKPLVYLDNAASAQTPLCVIEAIEQFYVEDCSNIHRGVHQLSERATQKYEGARQKIQHFINAEHAKEIIFVRGTTEAINLVASSFGQANVGVDDEIVISYMEHHSNIVPWQLLCERTGAHLRVIPMNERGELCMDEYEKLLGPRTKFVSVAHISNALGTINPVRDIVRQAHARGIPVMLDGAQAVPHIPVDVRELDCDFYAFSGHKLYGPTGIGVLYGKADLLGELQPYQGGGDMIRSVTFEKTTFNELPYRFEAGTPNISGAIGLGAAVDYVQRVGMARIAAYEVELERYATEQLKAVQGLKLIGTATDKAAVCSFVLEHVHPHDVGTILDQQGIAVRTGHHCAQPVMQHFGVPATVRASFALYNTHKEVDVLIQGLAKVAEIFRGS